MYFVLPSFLPFIHSYRLKLNIIFLCRPKRVKMASRHYDVFKRHESLAVYSCRGTTVREYYKLQSQSREDRTWCDIYYKHKCNIVFSVNKLTYGQT